VVSSINGSLANFTITFEDDPLVAKPNTDSQDIIKSIDMKSLGSNNGPINFKYERSRYQGSYYMIRSTNYKGAETLSIEAHNKNMKDVSMLAYFL
jgi:hypothetical protein